MRYLTLLLFAGCVFDTHSMPGDVATVDIYDGRGSIGVLGNADAALDAEAAAVDADADAEAADAAELDAEVDAPPDAESPAVDGAPPAATPDASSSSDAAKDASADAATPEPAEACERCETDLDCAPGLGCRFSTTELAPACLPDPSAPGGCGDFCDRPSGNICLLSARAACSCD